MAIAPSPSGEHGGRVLAWPSAPLARRALLGTVWAFGWFLVLAWLGTLDLADRGLAFQTTLGVAGLVGVVVAVSSGIAAAVAIARGERSIVLLAPLLLGAFWTAFVVGELLLPH